MPIICYSLRNSKVVQIQLADFMFDVYFFDSNLCHPR